MAHSPKLTNLGANTEADALAALFDNGYLRLYTGIKPLTADTAVGAQVLLASLRFGSPAFGASVSGVVTANALTSDADADATGTATWFRCFKADGTTPIMDGTAGTSDADAVFPTTSIVQHVEVACTGMTITASKG